MVLGEIWPLSRAFAFYSQNILFFRYLGNFLNLRILLQPRLSEFFCKSNYSIESNEFNFKKDSLLIWPEYKDICIRNVSCSKLISGSKDLDSLQRLLPSSGTTLRKSLDSKYASIRFVFVLGTLLKTMSVSFDDFIGLCTVWLIHYWLCSDH